ncbi:MFS transporter [Azospirillum largimobile]
MPPLLPVMAAAVLLQAGNGLLQALLPLRMQAQGLSATDIGMVASAYGVGFAAGCLAAPRVVRRLGFVRAYAGLAALMAILALALPLAGGSVGWVLLRALTGVGFAGLFTVIEGWIGAGAQDCNRGRLLAVYMVTTKLALMAGPLLLDPGGDQPFRLLILLILLSVLPVAVTRPVRPALPTAVSLDLRGLFRLAPSALVGCFVVGVVTGTMIAFAPLYGLRTGLSEPAAAALLVALQGGSLLAQWPLGALSDRRDRRVVIAAVAATGAALSAGLALLPAGSPAWLVWTGFALWGSQVLCIYALCVAHACDVVPPGRIVPTVSSLLVVWAAGAMVGPVPGALLMDWVGPSGLFVYAAVGCTALAGFVLIRRAMRERDQVPGRPDFRPLPPDSLTGAAISGPRPAIEPSGIEHSTIEPPGAGPSEGR